MRRDLLRTLFSRMLVTYLTVTLGLLLLTGITVGALLQGQAMREKKIALLDEVSLISDMAADGVIDETEALTLQVVARQYGMVQLYETDGTHTDYYDAYAWLPIANRTLSSAQLYDLLVQTSEQGGTTQAFFGSDTDFPILSAVQSRSENGKVVGVSVLHADITGVYASLGSVYLEVGIIALVAILFAVVAVFYTTSRMVRPFSEINDIVQQYAKGDFNVRIPINGPEESSQLAESFNLMADQLKDLENTRRSFVANVSHELRSPLTSMRGFLEAMQDGTIGPEEYEKYIGIVLSETRRMASMVNNLLDLARIESGRTALKLEEFDINELIRRTLITFEARISEKRMEVEVKFAQESYIVEADNAQISQVLRNLIDNAIKYSPDNRKLRIATYAMRNRVYISIQDFGVGIPEEDTVHVFDRFYKVEKAHTPSKQSGTGLGLSIVKKIIDQHGQTITLKSAKGKGSTFTFTLKRVLQRRPTDKNGLYGIQ